MLCHAITSRFLARSPTSITSLGWRAAALDRDAPTYLQASTLGARRAAALDLLITFSVGGFCFRDDNVRSVRGGQREVS